MLLMVWAISSLSESRSVCTFMKSNMAIYQDFKYLPVDPILLLQIYPQKYFYIFTKIYVTGCSLLHDYCKRKMEITKYPKIGKWLNKMWYIFTIKWYAAFKHNEIDLCVLS